MRGDYRHCPRGMLFPGSVTESERVSVSVISDSATLTRAPSGILQGRILELFPSGDRLIPGIEPRSSSLQADSLVSSLSHQGSGSVIRSLSLGQYVLNNIDIADCFLCARACWNYVSGKEASFHRKAPPWLTPRVFGVIVNTIWEEWSEPLRPSQGDAPGCC